MNDLSTAFDTQVQLKYQLYNSLFLTLPIDQISHTGILLPILNTYCEKGLKAGKNPAEIIETFFKDHDQFADDGQKLDFLFRVIQYIERQVVLVDALEDAAYDQINDLGGKGSFRGLIEHIQATSKQEQLASALQNYAVRIVLTAHPTQFYPGNVLAIITDLTDALQQNNLEDIRLLLQQLGNTPFFRKQKPTAFDEAVNLSWYLENVFYHAAGALYAQVLQRANVPQKQVNAQLLQFGFWPGGDRDGNPFVTTETTLKVAARLRHILLRCYYKDLRQLRRRLSFKGVYERLTAIEEVINGMLSHDDAQGYTLDEFLEELNAVEEILNENHGGLFLDKLTDFRNRVALFGFHFASIDLRQDSRIIARTMQSLLAHTPTLLPKNWASMDEQQQIDFLFALKTPCNASGLTDAIEVDTFNSFGIIQSIQQQNGEAGAHRYIISNCRSAIDIARVFALAHLGGWQGALTLDIIPLFETIDDLERAAESMKKIYENPVYIAHLKARGMQQTVMLGFSDGTKDGGYFSANWHIFKAKESLTALSRAYGISVLFFDGRGGPPARGGGNTQKFYTSLGNGIENKQIQLTVQGQTISSHYGTVVSAVHNLETLLVAGLENQLKEDNAKVLNASQRALLEELAKSSQAKYQALKEHPAFMPYLLKMSPLTYYGQANIGSRPAKRGSGEITFEDLRAIPFVGAWSQLKQNVPGFYGVGSSLKAIADAGRLEALQTLFKESSFFRALCENSMQSLSKTFFPVTHYMKHDDEFGAFWQMIYDEYTLSCAMLLKVSGQQKLLETNPTSRQSIALREQIVLPLITIQQYALMKLREGAHSDDQNRAVYEKLVIRSMFGNINASRNSA